MWVEYARLHELVDRVAQDRHVVVADPADTELRIVGDVREVEVHKLLDDVGLYNGHDVVSHGLDCQLEQPGVVFTDCP